MTDRLRCFRPGCNDLVDETFIAGEQVWCETHYWEMTEEVET